MSTRISIGKQELVSRSSERPRTPSPITWSNKRDSTWHWLRLRLIVRILSPSVFIAAEKERVKGTVVARVLVLVAVTVVAIKERRKIYSDDDDIVLQT